MTTADMVRTNEPCPIINDMFNSFVERAVFWKRSILVPAVSQPREQPGRGVREHRMAQPDHGSNHGAPVGRKESSG